MTSENNERLLKHTFYRKKQRRNSNNNITVGTVCTVFLLI
jgi:hypothetical protein